jgi:hypothetical protein
VFQHLVHMPLVQLDAVQLRIHHVHIMPELFPNQKFLLLRVTYYSTNVLFPIKKLIV